MPDEETTTEDVFDDTEPTIEAPMADTTEVADTTEDAFDTSEDSDSPYSNDGQPDDAYETDSGVDESIDLGGVPDEAPAPPDGWHKVKVGHFSSKPSKAGDKKWAFVLNFQNGYSHWNHFALGSPTGGEFAQRALKTFARACGIGDIEGKEGVLAPFKPGDLLDVYLYVQIVVNKEADFPVNITAFCPETDPPNEDIVSDQASEDDGLPF